MQTTRLELPNTTRVQMPDGTLLRLEGCNANEVAAILQEKLAQSRPTTNAEEPLSVPALNFSAAQAPAQTEGETALVMPTTG